MTTFDESGWREATTWSLAHPSPEDIWDALNANDVSAWFRGRLSEHLTTSELLQAGFAQHLRSEGVDHEQLLARVREAIGRTIRETTLDQRLSQDAERAAWKVAFTNLVSGRFTEVAFSDAYTTRLAGFGVNLVEAVADRSFLDFKLEPADSAEDFALAINVKNAGRQMRQAQQFFGLAPEDTIPMATYKAFGAEEADIPPLLYVYLIDWELLERLRAAYWEALSADEKVAFQALASFKGLSRNLEDDFITATVDHRIEALRGAVGYGSSQELNFRAISAARCHAIFYEHHERSPYVFIRRMNTDPNVHISIDRETTPFDRVIDEHLASPEGRAALVAGLRKTRSMPIPDPPL